MSHGYVSVQWNRNKIVYDLLLWLGIALFIGVFMGVTLTLHSGVEALSPMIVLIRAFAACAFVMLTLILCIGPLARLQPALLPLLYNRRHFGVSMFVVVLVHALLATIWYHSFGDLNPIVSIFTSPGEFDRISDLPFQRFGAAALVILFLMAATSHDFWNTNLGASMWKALHMGVYLAYALVVLHVATGALQEPNTGVSAAFLYGSVALVGGLHLAAMARGRGDALRIPTAEWVSIGPWRGIPNDAAITVQVGTDERVAVFRYDEHKLAAVANACKHQAGPLGEGRIIDGCITCPWHGFQYRPEDGCSPPPFTERLATYRLELRGDQVWLDPRALPEGTARPVLIIDGDSHEHT